ncbi:MAG: S24/S26 family peptidase [Bacteroidales bacterium]|nr:S24/S26 family peptidase [Bacteroidales bacterium]
MRSVDTKEYISMLRSLVEEGKQVSLIISGCSMSPFLIHARDAICFAKPDRELQKGDMVFFQRSDGNFVMHRIYKIKNGAYYIIGDAQTTMEGPIRREQIFALIKQVRRKGKWIAPGDFWWEFFAHIWLNIIPLRRIIIKVYHFF